MKLKYEPALTRAAIVAVLSLIIHAFDIRWLDTDAAEALATTIVIFIGAWSVRRNVTPTKKLEDRGLPVP